VGGMGSAGDRNWISDGGGVEGELKEREALSSTQRKCRDTAAGKHARPDVMLLNAR